MPADHNQIAASAGPSGLMPLIDGEPLDELLSRLAPELELADLVPTLLGCAFDAENVIVSERMLPDPGKTTMAPILMCPDDADLSCSVVIAEAVGTADSVVWSRLGIDVTPWDASYPANVGQQVNWFHRVGPFRFTRADYLAALNAFKRNGT